MIQSQQYAQKSLVVSESSNVGKRKLRASRHPIEEVEPKTTRSRDHFGTEQDDLGAQIPTKQNSAPKYAFQAKLSRDQKLDQALNSITKVTSQAPHRHQSFKLSPSQLNSQVSQNSGIRKRESIGSPSEYADSYSSK